MTFTAYGFVVEQTRMYKLCDSLAPEPDTNRPTRPDADAMTKAAGSVKTVISVLASNFPALITLLTLSKTSNVSRSAS